MEYKFKEQKIKGVFEITPFHALDNRGSVFKEYDKKIFSENGIHFIPQESMLISSKRNVIRGLHFQRIQEQDRLVRCIAGRVWAAVVDLRLDSSTLGKWLNVDINDGGETYIPKGCAFGTFAISDALILCMYGEKYDSNYADGICWNDDIISVEWPIHDIDGEIIVSDKDIKLMSYKDYLMKQQEGHKY